MLVEMKKKQMARGFSSARKTPFFEEMVQFLKITLLALASCENEEKKIVLKQNVANSYVL